MKPNLIFLSMALFARVGLSCCCMLPPPPGTVDGAITSSTPVLSLSTSANSGQFVLNADGSVTHAGTSGQQDFQITRTSTNQLTFQGQTSGLESSAYLMAKDGDTTDNVQFAAFGRGVPGTLTNFEGVSLGWLVSAARYELAVFAGGTGTSRTLSIHTQGNAAQFTINTDGSVTHGGTTSQQDWQFTRAFTHRLALQGKQAGQPGLVEVFANDGDTTDEVGIQLFGRGTPTSTTNIELLNVGWNVGTSRYELVTYRGGTGVARALGLGSDGNTDQLLLNTDGTTQVDNDFKIVTTGKGLFVKDGTNGKIGQATLVAGTVTIPNTSVTANSRIFLSVSTTGGTQGILSYTKVAGASFTINSTSVSETSTVDWFIVESIP